MIYEALLVPTESPPTLREIKRALITYDKVALVDPGDRELFPRNAFATAIMGTPLFGIDTGPVRPMGKVVAYDDRFERTLDFCKPAVSQRLLEVKSTYVAEDQSQVTIGAVPTGGYPLNPRFVYLLYRGLAQSQDFLRAALRHDLPRLESQLLAHPGLALAGFADGSVNQGPKLPIADIVATNVNGEALTQIARARLGAIVKYSGYCEAKNLVPVFGMLAYSDVLVRLLDRTRQFLAAGDEGGSYMRRNRVLDLAHEEFLVDERLDGLSVEDIIRLRTKAWGDQATARERLFASAFEIAESVKHDSSFHAKAQEIIRDYRRASEELVRERGALQHAIKCDIATGSLGGGVAIAGLISQLESPLTSVGVTLAAATIWALERAKEYVPKIKELQAQTAELKRGAGFALHDFYSRLPDV
jgi:hypothetical protein